MANKRILLVEHDSKTLAYTRNLLQTAGFDVSTCSDGLAALENFKSLNPDLVLLSPMLPKMHGFEVCSNIRKIPGGSKIPVVIITDVYKGKRYRLDALNKYGATEYIEKPIEDSNLLSILQNLVGNNGTALTTTTAKPAIDESPERTVSISAEEMKQAMNAMPKPTVQAKPAAPATVQKKARTIDDDDEINRKLEESLAGLSLDFTKGTLAKIKSKPKPADAAKPAATQKPAEPSKAPAPAVAKPAVASAPQPTPPPPPAPATPSVPAAAPVVPPQKPILPTVGGIGATISSDVTFTSEDLFTDVIASVEKELEYEKIITKSGAKQKSGAITNPLEAQAKQTQEPEKVIASPSFEEELEKRISSTLSGIVKDKAKTEAAPAKAETPEQNKEEPAPPTVQLTREFVQEAMVSAAISAGEGINFGQYLLLTKIATGGMAELFKAKRKGVEGFEKILAIKRILPHMLDNEEFITMFIDEAKLAAQLTHQNICQIFDLGKIENSYYIAMEFVHGKDLRAVLKAARQQQKSVPVELAILITSKICSALDYAHRKNDMNGQPLNLVHRDVSPQNILISYEGDVKLVDFGIAKAATKVHVTQHGALKGKLLYMSPEQAWGKPVDKRSDVFSVGGVLYEMLTGRPMFFAEHDTEVTILEKVREAQITPIRSLLPDIPGELEKILSKSLQKNQDDRYQAAAEMQKDLDNLFYTEGYNATSASLANFARALFPEDWVQEAGGRETIVLSKEASDAVKAQVVEKSPEVPSAAVPKSKAKDKHAKVSESKPQPSATDKTQQSPAITAPTAAVKLPETPVVAKVETIPEKISEPVPEPVAAIEEQSNAEVRDISLPEILVPQQSSGNTMKFLAGGLVLAALVGGGLYFMFRPKPAPNEVKSKQTQQAPIKTAQSQSPAPVAQQESVTPTPVAPQNEDAQKQELLKRIEEEKKKIEAMKAEAQKKNEDQQKLEQQKLAEQQKLEDQKKEEARQQEEKRLADEKVAADKAAEEQRLREEAEAEQARLAQLQQAQQPPPTPAPATEDPAAAQPVPQEPAVNEGDLVELTPDVTKPVLTKKVEAEYPPLARQKKIEGTVILQLLVNEKGQVSDVKVLRPAGGSTGLNESAVTAVQKWVFRPAVKAGKRVKVLMTYPIHFKLQS